MNYEIINGDSKEVLKNLPDNSVDSIVTDPPYGISFLGKDWDSKKATKTTSKIVALSGLPSGMKFTSLADDLEFQTWLKTIFSECLRVLKPGGHLLAFSAARTYHHTAMAAQLAGFEVRDQIMWIYGSGFPKSQDVGRSIQRSLLEKKGNVDMEQVIVTDPVAQQWSGWGTQLKPAHEPIVMARKPMKDSIAKNAQQWGTGAINVDATRVPYADEKDKNSIVHNVPTATWSGHTIQLDSYENGGYVTVETNELGRFPANVIHDGSDEVINLFPNGDGSAARFFYCAKVSKKERHIGHEMPTPTGDDGNNHPTVKPVELMKYLVRLVTPPGGLVVDPFNGSGSTGMAAVSQGFSYIGIDLDEKYCEISKKRIEGYCNGRH